MELITELLRLGGKKSSHAAHDLAAFLSRIHLERLNDIQWDEELVAKWYQYIQDVELSARRAVICAKFAGEVFSSFKGLRERLSEGVKKKGEEMYVKKMKDAFDIIDCMRYTKLTPEQRELARRLVQSEFGREGSIQRFRVSRIAQMSSAFRDLCEFEGLDGPAITSRVKEMGFKGSTGHWPSMLIDIRCLPDWADHQQFASHLRAVPRWLMDEQPLLYNFPAGVGRVLLRDVQLKDDRDWLMAFMDALLCHRTLQWPRRNKYHTAASIGNTVWEIFPGLVCASRSLGHPTIRSMMGQLSSVQALVDIVARVRCTALRNSKHHKIHYRNGDGALVPHERRLVSFWNGVIASELTSIPCETRIKVPQLTRAMADLNRSDPMQWPLTSNRVAEQAPKPHITQEDVVKILSHKQLTHQERALILTLYTTALRIGAIQALQLCTVWDDATGTVRSKWVVLEKNSVQRIVWPCEELRAAMYAYITKEYQPNYTWLFAHRMRPTIKPSALNSLLGRLCARAGLPTFNAHQFRALMVDMFLEGGNRLEDASKFLGHVDPGITYRHYYKRDPARDIKIPFFASSCGQSDSTTELRLLEEITAQNEVLEMGRREMECEIARLRRELIKARGEEEVVPSPLPEYLEGEITENPMDLI